MSLNLRVRDLDAMVAQLRAAGIEVEGGPQRTSPYGRFARTHDPEGNPIELWQPLEDADTPAPNRWMSATAPSIAGHGGISRVGW